MKGQLRGPSRTGQELRVERGPNVWTHHVGQCRGVTLWMGKRVHVELWVCREGIPEHRHPGQRVEVVPLFGRARFYRVTVEGFRQLIRIGPRLWGRAFTVPAGWPHWFTVERMGVLGAWLVFVNVTFNGAGAGENIEYGK